MNYKICALSIISTMIVVFSGCSVADPGKTLNPVAGLPEDTPAPVAPITPVLVSEPMPVVSTAPENAPEAAPAPAPTPADVTAPVVTPTPATTPVATTEPEAAPVTSTPPEEMPEPIATIEETPTSPAATLIDVTEIVNVSVPVSTPALVAAEPDNSYSNNDSYAQPVPESEMPPVAATEPNLPPANVETVPETMPIPPAIMEVVEISNPTPEYQNNPPQEAQNPYQEIAPAPMPSPVQEVTPTPVAASPMPSPTPMPAAVSPMPAPVVAGPAPSSTYDDEDEDVNPVTGVVESDEDTEFTVSGSCLGKKNAGVVWYDNRNKNKKKNSSVHCKNNKFEIKIKDKKKNLPYLEIQTLFYD